MYNTSCLSREPYFATFSIIVFNVLAHIFVISLKLMVKKLGIHYHKRKKIVSMKDEYITEDYKYVVKYGHPAKYGSLLYMYICFLHDDCLLDTSL